MTRKTITYKGLSVRDPAPYGEAGLAWQNNFKALADRIGPCKFDATTAPTATDDSSSGYSTGSLWYNPTANRLYWCASAAAGAATWIEVSPADLSSVYQPLNANLTTWAGVAPSADGRAIVSAADYAAMRGLLGLVAGVDVQAYSANLDTWSGVAPSADGQSLVAAVDYAAMRGLLGLGTMATQAADAVAITGGVISGIADLAVADGGTGASDALSARANLGLVIGTDVQAYSANLTTWSGVASSADGRAIVSAADYAEMRGLLGLGTMATQEAGSVAITGGSIAGITDLAVADGGTGASDAATARGNLGLGSIATQAANSVAITGGTIDGTAIGATTPEAGTFTTLSATGTIDTPATSSSTVGVVKVGDLLIHGFRHPTGDTARPEGSNVFIGMSAGNFTMGAEATSTSHGSRNTGIGTAALYSLTTGYSNVAVGQWALFAATEGNENTALGRIALHALTTGSRNTGIGNEAIYRLTTGYGNVAVGDRALSAATEGNENTAVGRLALHVLTTGTRNVGLGYYAGRYTSGNGDNQTTSNSTYIGSLTRAFADGVNNETVIGYNAVGKGSNTVQIGNSFVTDTYLSGWLNLQSDTQGIKLDAAGTTTLISNGTVATLSKPLKAAGYQSSDGSAGINQTIAITDKSDVTHTMVFKNGLLTSYTTNP